MNTLLFQKFYKTHRWLGYFLSAHLILLFVSGIILVFRAELSSEPDQKARTSQLISLQEIIDTSQRLKPKDRIVALGMDDDDPMKVTVRMGKDGSSRFRGAERLSFDRYAGFLDQQKQKHPLLDTILVFHREFLLGFYGKLFVGLIGILFTLSLLSGIIVYGPTTKLGFGEIRRGFSASFKWIDAHKFLGSCCVVWFLLMGISGSLLSYSGQLLRIYQFTVLKGLEAEYSAPAPLSTQGIPNFSIERAESAVRMHGIRGNISFVTFPGSEFSTAHHYIFLIDGPSSWTEHFKTLVLVHAESFKIDKVLELPWYLKAVLIAEPLHFGNYGGLLLKIIWSLFGILGCFVVLSSLMILRAKRSSNQKAKSAPNPAKRRRFSPYLGPAIISLAIALPIASAIAAEGNLDTLIGATMLLPLCYIAYKILAPS